MWTQLRGLCYQNTTPWTNWNGCCYYPHFTENHLGHLKKWSSPFIRSHSLLKTEIITNHIVLFTALQSFPTSVIFTLLFWKRQFVELFGKKKCSFSSNIFILTVMGSEGNFAGTENERYQGKDVAVPKNQLDLPRQSELCWARCTAAAQRDLCAVSTWAGSPPVPAGTQTSSTQHLLPGIVLGPPETWRFTPFHQGSLDSSP